MMKRIEVNEKKVFKKEGPNILNISKYESFKIDTSKTNRFGMNLPREAVSNLSAYKSTESSNSLNTSKFVLT